MPTLSPPKKILTVDDNAIVSADVRTILEAAGYESAQTPATACRRSSTCASTSPT
jgi:PleD family two-component response regulator